MNNDDNPKTELCSTTEPAPTKQRSRRRHSALPRISYSVAEYGRMTGRRPDAVRREIERKAQRDGDALTADLGLGVRAVKPARAGRWSIVVPRSLVAE